MFPSLRGHHHPVDACETDDRDEIAEEETLEEMRQLAAWEPVIDLPTPLESPRRTVGPRRRLERARLSRAWRRRTARR
jgi:hypothetical protein